MKGRPNIGAIKKFLANDPKSVLGKFLSANILFSGHLEGISKACSGMPKFIIGIRETGATSIVRIGQGAKAKPHTIMEKSIKPSSMTKIYGAGWMKATKAFYKTFKGFVGHYGVLKGKNVLLGLRTDGWKGPKEVKVKQCGARCSYLETEKALILLKANLILNAKHFYTGDYDLHEVYNNAQRQLPEATIAKVRLLNILNAKIAHYEKTPNIPKRTGVFALLKGRITHARGSESSYGMFQHGDQATYKMNQHLEAQEKGGKVQLIHAVNSESNEPIGWNIRGVWYVTKNKVEHGALRTALGLRSPTSWRLEKS